MEIIIITGLSGAGKSIAIKSLEDMGFFCIDNLPVNLLAKMVELSSLSESKLDRVGVVIDVRGRTFFKELETELRYLETGGIPHRIIFLEASDGALIRRYKESRRIHPLSVEKGIAESINEERKLLQAIKKRADLVIDTSDISMNQLRSNLRKYLSETAAGEDFQLVLISFGYKYGIPLDADIVFDVRFLPNPFWVAELKDLDGFDPRVAGYVLGKREAVRFVRDFEKMLKFLMPLYVKEGKSFLTLAIGCTGGRHRSVAISEVLAGYMRELSFDVHVRHRDVERGVGLPYYVKDELSRVHGNRRCCRQAELSALMRTEGTLHLQGNNQLAIHTESENASVARAIITLARELFDRTPDLSLQKMPRLRNQVCYCLSFYEGDNLLQILNELGILDAHTRPLDGIPQRLLKDRCCKVSYLRGAFLGCGFLGDMRKNKHLEFNLSNQDMAEGILSLLSDLGLTAGYFQRRSSYVVYLKRKESILELLALMGAHATVLRIENDLIVSSIKEDVNRRVNCETANLRKVTRAAQEQINNIRLIEEELGLSRLAPSLQDIALVRLDHPDFSLVELGNCTDPPISKSAAYHRLSRIAAIARQLAT